MGTSWKESHYRKARAAGLGARSAWHYATVRDRFDNEKEAGRVRLLTVCDECADIADAIGEPPGLPGDNVRAVVAQQKAIRRMIERDGINGILAQVVRDGCEEQANAERDSERSPYWETVDSLFGIVGDPFDKESGCEWDYATDLRAAALDALDKREADARALAGDVATVREYVAGNGDVADAFGRIVARLEGGTE